MTKLIAQSAWFAVFACGIGLLSVMPRYRHLAADQALLKLSISHAGAIVGNCRQRSAEELAKLAKNMRAERDCPRTRSPVTVELSVDGKLLYREPIAASGLARDGAATVYRRFVLPAGEHRIRARVSDDAARPDFYFERTANLHLKPEQVVVVDFNQQLGGVLIK